MFTRGFPEHFLESGTENSNKTARNKVSGKMPPLTTCQFVRKYKGIRHFRSHHSQAETFGKIPDLGKTPQDRPESGPDVDREKIYCIVKNKCPETYQDRIPCICGRRMEIRKAVCLCEDRSVYCRRMGGPHLLIRKEQSRKFFRACLLRQRGMDDHVHGMEVLETRQGLRHRNS